MIDQKLVAVLGRLEDAPLAGKLLSEIAALNLPPDRREERNQILAAINGTTPAEIAKAFDRIAEEMRRA